MALSTLTQTAYNAPYALDETQTRIWVRGTFKFSGTSGTYATGGLLPNWNVTTFALSGLQDKSGAAVEVGTLSQSPIFNISAYAVSSNVVTIYSTSVLGGSPPVNNLAALQWVSFSGLGVATFLNGLTLQVQSATSGSFTVDFTTANASKTTDSGQAGLVIGPDELYIESISGSGFLYGYNKANATVQVFTTGTASGDALNELAAGTTPAGVVSDIIHFTASWAKN